MPINQSLLKEKVNELNESQAKRFNEDPNIVNKAVAWYSIWVANKNKLDQMRKAKNDMNKQIGQLKKKKENADELILESKLMSCKIEVQEQLVQFLSESTKKATHKIGNIIDPSVPVSNDEENNLVLNVHENEKMYNSTILRHHHQLLYRIGGFEPERGVRAAGHRGYYLTGIAVNLCLGLANYALKFLEEKSYKRVIPPYFLKRETMAKVAELDDFDEQLYHVSTASKKSDQDYSFLIATSEQPLCALHEKEILNPKELPIKYAGYSPCFRKEAGKHGKDTWGIFRVHQFEKIEQFVICKPEDSKALHEEMRELSEEFLKSLGLSYRVVCIVSGELNNAASKKYDIEAFFPGYNEHKELVSCSNCLDYQSRAVGTRYGKGEYVHMLNSTLCAVQRTVCCLLENYQQEDGVKVPEVLIPFVGTDFMPFIREELPSMKEK